MNWDIDSINARIEELELKKNRLIMVLNNDRNKIGKEILEIESRIMLNRDIKRAIENERSFEFH